MTTTTRTYHRRSQTRQHCFNRRGYGMFAYCENGGERVESYGDNHWTFSGETIPAEDVIAAANEVGFEEEFGADASCLDPKDIVDSAEGWDNPAVVSWVWENVCEAREWHAIETSDGVILFDEALAVYVGS